MAKKVQSGEEPKWELKGRDATAPLTILHWAAQARRFGVDSAKVQGALQDALNMAAWQQANGSKIPD